MTRVRTGVGTIGALALSITLIAGCSSGARQPFAVDSTTTRMIGPPETLPPPVVSGGSNPYKLTVAGDGSTIRFDGCSGPIRILLNPGDLPAVVAEYTDVDVAAQLGELLTQYAQELSELTGFEIVYGGATNIGPDASLTEQQVIVLNFGSIGFPGREDEYTDSVFLYGGKIEDGWIQIGSHQHFENSTGFTVHYTETLKLKNGDRSIGIDDAGKRSLKTLLGQALGLAQLTEEDMLTAGVPVEEHGAQIMYTDSHVELEGVYNLAWGDGDKTGLAAVGASNACF